MLNETDVNNIELIKEKALYVLQEEAFLSQENAEYILNVFVEGTSLKEKVSMKGNVVCLNEKSQVTEKNQNIKKSSKRKTKDSNEPQLVNYIGKRLDGRYEVIEIIGVGEKSIVYRAYDNVNSQIVAVKIFKNMFLSNNDFIKRYKFEAKAITTLSHPNIVKVYDVCFGEKLQYIVMEYVVGITLKEYLQNQGAIAWNDALFIMKEILRAIQEAHSKGIIHGALKPQNIILLPTGNIKVVDFGITRFSETRTFTCNSIQYISPESVTGETEDERTDIYLAGVMFYEMLVGAFSSQIDEPIYIVLMNIQNNVKRLTKINTNIPIDIEQICVRAIQKDKIDRYNCVDEMLCDIDSVIKSPYTTFNSKPKINNLKQKNIVNLREYLLSLPEGRLSCEKTLDLFLPFMDFLIEKNKKKDIDIFPNNIYYVFNKNILTFDVFKETKDINIGYSALETHKRSVRNETAIVYSIAACIFRTLVGKNPPSAVEREVDDKLMMPNEVAEGIPIHVIKALSGALQVRPENRTRTISEFRDALCVDNSVNKSKSSTKTKQSILKQFFDVFNK